MVLLALFAAGCIEKNPDDGALDGDVDTGEGLGSSSGAAEGGGGGSPGASDCALGSGVSDGSVAGDEAATSGADGETALDGGGDAPPTDALEAGDATASQDISSFADSGTDAPTASDGGAGPCVNTSTTCIGAADYVCVSGEWQPLYGPQTCCHTTGRFTVLPATSPALPNTSATAAVLDSTTGLVWARYEVLTSSTAIVDLCATLSYNGTAMRAPALSELMASSSAPHRSSMA